MRTNQLTALGYEAILPIVRPCSELRPLAKDSDGPTLWGLFTPHAGPGCLALIDKATKAEAEADIDMAKAEAGRGYWFPCRCGLQCRHCGHAVMTNGQGAIERHSNVSEPWPEECAGSGQRAEGIY